MNKNQFCFSKSKLKTLLLLIIVFLILSLGIVKLSNLVNTKNTAIVKSKAAESNSYISAEVFNKKVYQIIFDPIVTDSTGQKIKFSEYLKNTNKSYNDPRTLSENVIASFKKSTNHRLNYSVVKQTVADYFPEKEGGYVLDREDLEYCIAHGNDRLKDDKFKKICPGGADYNKIFDKYKICQDINKNKIDEVWIWGYAWFGFSESALIGPKPFPYNGLIISNSACNKLIPIMGFNFERGLGEALHDFGHRAEASMTTVYQNWSENRKRTKWDLFGLVKAQSSDFKYSGCGTAHYTPISNSDYDYDTQGRQIETVCENFSDFNIFNSNDLLSRDLKKSVIDCKISPWLCTQEGYFEWWFSRFPKYNGIDSDGVLNDWLKYIVDPTTVNEYRAKVSFNCKDNNEFGKVFGAMECENKKQSSVQCKWFDFCNKCETSNKIVADVCPNFCSQWDNNINGCTSAEKKGLGCIWVGTGKEKCVAKSTASDLTITALNSQPNNPTLIDANIIINNNNLFDLEKKLLVDVNSSNKSIITNKELAVNPTKLIPYRFYLGEKDRNLDEANKYIVIPKLDFYNTKNPPNYTVTARECPRTILSESNSCFYNLIPIFLNYVVNIGSISCYNLGNPKACANTNDKCYWSDPYKACFNTEDKESDAIIKFCSSIKKENICGNYSVDCTWKNNVCSAVTLIPTPASCKGLDSKDCISPKCKWHNFCNKCSDENTLIGLECANYCHVYDDKLDECKKSQDSGSGCAWDGAIRQCIPNIPKPTTTPLPVNSYKVFLSTNFYNATIIDSYMPNINGISEQYVENLKYKITYLKESKKIRQEYKSIKLGNQITLYVKNGIDLSIEIIGNIVTNNSCKDCSIMIGSTYGSVYGKLSPSNLSISYNDYIIAPETLGEFRIYLTKTNPVVGKECKDKTSLCKGSRTDICYTFPQIAEGDVCRYCDKKGQWVSLPQSSLVCNPKVLY